MTRSILPRYSPEVTKKTFRANAKAQCMSFKAAAEARNLLPKPKLPVAPGMGRRTHGKMENTMWNGTAYVDLGEYVEGDLVCGVDDYREWSIQYIPHVVNADGKAPSAPSLPSLLDLAKPAKLKGVAKDFEVVDSVKKVIALHDEHEEMCYEDLEWDDDWEEIHVEGNASVAEEKVSYSAVVKGKERGEGAGGT